MNLVKKELFLVLFLALIFATDLFSAEQKQKTKKSGLIVVGLYSETEEGAHVSYRVGSGEWIIAKVDDVIPANGEIKVSVAWDWVEVVPTDNPNVVYEITGSDEGDVIKKVSNLLKEKGKRVSFPKAGKGKNPNFKNKLVVKKYLGRHFYINPQGSQVEIKYGDILDIKGKINMIAINTTLDLMFPDGRKVVQIVGPIKFELEKLYKGEKIYKYLNITK